MSRGILLAAYNCADTLNECLAPWLELKKEFGFIISCVSVPFREYRDMAVPADNTRQLLDGYLECEEIDFAIFDPPFIPEYQARDLALRPLLASEVDSVMLLDGDELWTEKQIRAAYRFWDKSEDVCWASIHMKNIFGNGKGYVDGFAPPRLFRAKCGNLELHRCYYDNDFEYIRDDGSEFDYKNLPKVVIPKAVTHVRHVSWTNSERSRLKILYQNKREGWMCSYRWDEATKSVQFNPEYFKKVGQPIPEVIYD